MTRAPSEHAPQTKRYEHEYQGKNDQRGHPTSKTLHALHRTRAANLQTDQLLDAALALGFRIALVGPCC
jgi:hypothetical protein